MGIGCDFVLSRVYDACYGLGQYLAEYGIGGIGRGLLNGGARGHGLG